MGVIKRVIADNLDPKGKTTSHDFPEWSVIGQLIKRLDGFQFTEVCLMVEEEEIGMHITGGDRGYVCEIMTGKNSYVLIGKNSSSEKACSIMKNGPPDFPERMVVELDKVIKAAKYYFDTGELDPSLDWED